MATKYEKLGVEINIGKKSLLVLTDSLDLRHSFVNLYDSDGNCVGNLELHKNGYDLIRSGGKLEIKSVSQFKKEIK